MRAVGREMAKLGRKGGEGGLGGERAEERESWEVGGWEEWVSGEMGMDFRYCRAARKIDMDWVG